MSLGKTKPILGLRIADCGSRIEETDLPRDAPRSAASGLRGPVVQTNPIRRDLPHKTKPIPAVAAVTGPHYSTIPSFQPSPIVQSKPNVEGVSSVKCRVLSRASSLCTTAINNGIMCPLKLDFSTGFCMEVNRDKGYGGTLWQRPSLSHSMTNRLA